MRTNTKQTQYKRNTNVTETQHKRNTNTTQTKHNTTQNSTTDLCSGQRGQLSAGEGSVVIQAGLGEARLQCWSRTRFALHPSHQHWRGGELTTGWRGGRGERTGGKPLQGLTKHFKVCEW